MSILEDQLVRWANAPGSTKIQSTHQQIRNALANYPKLLKVKYEPYLQGSYSNSTNIRSDSDVDLVVELQQSWYRDLSLLSTDQRVAYERDHNNVAYGFYDFKSDVIEALNYAFGPNYVKPGKKSIKVLADLNRNRIDADVVPCVQHRVYDWYVGTKQEMHSFKHGMKFYDLNGNLITNFPKLHKENGESKNHQLRTNEKYKDTVRIIKNIKRQLVENGVIDKKLAPSYFVECLVYNIPDWIFGESTYKDIIRLSLGHLSLPTTDWSSFMTASHRHVLFGREAWHWDVDKARFFVQELGRQVL
jgi:hypothetical protein